MTQNGMPITPPEHWRVATLSDAVEIWDRKRVPVNKTERDKRVGDVPYYGATGQVGWIDDYLFDDELVLLGEDGAPFLEHNKQKAYIIRGKSWVNNHAHVLKAREGVESAFIKHYLDIVDYRPFVSGTTRLKLTQAAMRRILVPLPCTDEQKQVVDQIETQLARLDDAVAALQRARTRLKRYRASVLKAACEGRLVPTEAELARQEGRDYELASVLLERIKAERETSANGKRLKSKKAPPPDMSELATLPQGWAWTKWEDLAGRVTVGHVGPMKHEYVPTGIPFLRSQNVRENRFDSAGLLFITPEFHVKLSKSRIVPGDLAVVRSGSVGVTCVIPESLGEANCADLVLIQRPEGIVPQYGAYYMNSLAKRLIRQGQVGVALIHFNTKSVAALPVPLPPLAEQNRIVAEVERRLSILDQLETTVDTNLKRADTLRQSILRKAFSGGFASVL